MASPSGDTAASSVPELVREFAGRLAPARPARVRDDDEFIRDLAYDSLAMFALQFALEEMFLLDPIPPEEVFTVWTVADLVRLVDGLIATAHGSAPNASVVEALREQYREAPRT